MNTDTTTGNASCPNQGKSLDVSPVRRVDNRLIDRVRIECDGCGHLLLERSGIVMAFGEAHLMREEVMAALTAHLASPQAGEAMGL